MAIISEDVSYTDGDTPCSGVLVYDDALTGKQPGVMLVHEALGLGEHVLDRARMVAELGYVAFAADLFGERRQLANMDEVQAVALPLRQDIAAHRARAKAGLAALAGAAQVDPAKLFSIGFCLGGTTSLELARSGADLLGVVCFHGGLDTQQPADAGTIKARVLACIGADDPMIPAEQRTAFEDEMRASEVDWQLHVYGGTGHSFTNPAADQMGMPGVAYHEQTDRRSWKAMGDFFEECLQRA